MRTSAHALRDAMDRGAVAAWYRGDKVQSAVVGMNPNWLLYKEHDGSSPDFSNPQLIWSPVATRPRQPFTRSTVPKGALWKKKGSFTWLVPTAYCENHLFLSDGSSTGYEELDGVYEYSIDGGVTWGKANQEMKG